MSQAKPIDPPSGTAALPLSRTLKLPEVQELWYALQKKPWLSLSVVPAHAGGSARDLARALAEVGTALRGSAVHLFSAENSDSDAVVRAMVSIRTYTRANELVVIALDPPVRNPTSISVIRAADAALIAIEMGKADLASARKTIELVGPDRLLGSAMLQLE